MPLRLLTLSSRFVLQPTSNLLFGHLLWADGNYSGATLHYHRVLEVYPGMDQALSSLRALRCYVKYHYVPPKPTAPKSSKRSCNRCRSQSNENHVSTCGKGKNRGCSKKVCCAHAIGCSVFVLFSPEGS